MARVKIDVLNKLIEIDGEEDFIREIYDKSRPFFVLPDAVKSSQQITIRRQHKNGSLKESYAIIKNLDLSQPISLRDFYEKKTPQSALEKNTVFIYYLSKIASKKNINLNHIYSCYKAVGQKMPVALKQSLADTSSKKGWIETKSMNDIKITLKGEGLVERELV